MTSRFILLIRERMDKGESHGVYIRVSALCQLELDMLATEDKSMDQDQGEYYLQYLQYLQYLHTTVDSCLNYLLNTCLHYQQYSMVRLFKLCHSISHNEVPFDT